MNLKFELKASRSTRSIVNVSVDEVGNIQNLSCKDIMLEKKLSNDSFNEEFKNFVKKTLLGTICSNQVDVGNITYKVELLA